MKKLFFVTLLSIFMAFSSFAQSKVDRFLGNWNLTQAKDISKIKSYTYNVSQTNGELKIERNIQNVNSQNEYSDTKLYKNEGSVSFKLVADQLGGVSETKMRVINPLKIRFDRTNTTKNRFARYWEVWSLSKDGKTLTIEYFSSSGDYNNSMVNNLELEKVYYGGKSVFSKI